MGAKQAGGGDRMSLLVRNATASMVRAVSGSVTTVLIPLVLLWQIPYVPYSAWVLVFTIATYVLYLDLGMLPSVQALAARHAARGTSRAAATIGVAGLALAAAVASLAVLASLVVAANMSALLPTVPPSLVSEAGAALVYLVFAQGTALCASVVAAYYAGLHRSRFPTQIIVGGRVVSLGAVAIASSLTPDLEVLAIALATPLVASALVLAAALVREWTSLGVPHRWSTRSVVGAAASKWALLVTHSGPLAVGNIGVLVIAGAAPVVLAREHFESVGLYSVAAVCIAGVTGLSAALAVPLLSELGRADAGGSRSRYSVVLALGLRVNAIVLGVLLVLASGAAVTILIARGGALLEGAHGATVVLLVFTGTLRQVIAPVAIAAIARGTHRKLVLPAILEAALYLTILVAAAPRIGLWAVVAASAVAALVSILVLSTWALRVGGLLTAVNPRAVGIEIARFLSIGLIPVLAATIAMSLEPVQSWSTAVIVASGVAVGLAIAAAHGRRSIDHVRRVREALTRDG